MVSSSSCVSRRRRAYSAGNARARNRCSGTHTSGRCSKGWRHVGQALTPKWSMALCTHQKHPAWPHLGTAGLHMGSSRHTAHRQSLTSSDIVANGVD